MKNFFFLAAILLSTVACNNDSELTTLVENNEGYAPVTVHVSNFSITTEEMPSPESTRRAAVDPANYSPVGAMTLAFYDADGTEVYKTTQLKSTTPSGFGTFTANLQVGTYTMVAVGYAYTDGDVFTLTSPTVAAFTTERPRETFCATQSVTVTSTSPLDLSVTLNRICSRLTIKSTDNRPAGIGSIRTTYAKGDKSFNPTTGLALSDAGFTLTNTPSATVGSTITVSSYPFLTSADDEEEEIDITIEVLDNNNAVLFTHTIENVPFKRNRKTTLQGNLFTAGTSSAAFETAWLTDPDPIDF